MFLRAGIREVCICTICKDWELGKLTIKEAWRNLSEARLSGFDSEEDISHYWDVAEKLMDIEDETSKT